MIKASKKLKKNRGVALVEILIASSIILAFVLALLGVHSLYLKTAFSTSNVIKAAELAEESLEVMRFFRDSSWDSNIATLSLDTDYFLIFEGGVWEATTTSYLIDDRFERKVRVMSVNRDLNSDITDTGGTLDPDTLKVTTEVSWSTSSGAIAKTISTYLANIYDE